MSKRAWIIGWVVFVAFNLVLLQLIFVTLAEADTFTPEEMEEQVSVLVGEIDPVETPEPDTSQGVLIPPLNSSDTAAHTNTHESPARSSDRNVGLPKAGW